MNTAESILNAAGVHNRETRFVQPPAGDYAVWADTVSTDGPDGINAILYHDYTVELYTRAPAPATEAAVETAMDAAGVRWTKQDRYWIETESIYQIIYEFSETEKRRNY